METIFKKIKTAALFFVMLFALIAIFLPFWPMIEYEVNPPNQEELEQEIFSIEDGDWLLIPKIGIRMPIFEGNENIALEKGAWKMPETSTPDQGGNTAITAHRFKYLPPSEKTFYLLDKMETGDSFKIFWKGEEYNYEIFSKQVIGESDLEILNPTQEPIVTLITCHPLFSIKQRLVVRGVLFEPEIED